MARVDRAVGRRRLPGAVSRSAWCGLEFGAAVAVHQGRDGRRSRGGGGQVEHRSSEVGRSRLGRAGGLYPYFAPSRGGERLFSGEYRGTPGGKRFRGGPEQIGGLGLKSHLTSR